MFSPDKMGLDPGTPNNHLKTDVWLKKDLPGKKHIIRLKQPFVNGWLSVGVRPFTFFPSSHLPILSGEKDGLGRSRRRNVALVTGRKVVSMGCGLVKVKGEVSVVMYGDVSPYHPPQKKDVFGKSM